MANRKVPSQAASGRETFNDNLVGNQITDGSSQLTATNFSIDKSIPERDVKNFKTAPFSEFLTLDDLKQETSLDTSSTTKKEEIKFKSSKDVGSKSLYGSLKQRLSSSVKRIIQRFPAGMYVDKDTPVSVSQYTAENITYSPNSNTTTFKFEKSKIFNPLDIVLEKPASNTQPEVTNTFKNFFTNYKKYTLELNGVTFDIISYTKVNTNGLITLTVKGQPFSGSTYSESFLIRPIDSVVEEFFQNLNDIESLILDRETTPKYTSQFKLPKDSLDGSKTETTTVRLTWPIFKDGWNIKIGGLDYVSYLEKLNSVGDEIDDYKSNLISRFLTSASLSEFDTEDQRMSSIFQIYGNSFDSVKKYIDNIAYMRNVSYDKINNIPDALLKNLANTLGLSTINLFDEKSLEETLYNRVDSQFDGVSLGMNMVEAETEFYRRLLINLVRIYKSKGTRKSIEFFLRFVGAPEPLIKIDEYVYGYDNVKKSINDIYSDVYDLTQTTKTFTTAELNTSLFGYDSVVTTGTTIYNTEEYPIKLTGSTSGVTQSIISEKNNQFFQKGAGWFEENLDHRSPLELDTENSDLTVTPKIIKTKNKNFTYGEDYYNLYRQFYGLDYGYELHNKIDNNKIELIEGESGNILNRKNIQVYLSSAQGIDYDIYRQSRELEVSFGSNTLSSQTGFTFAEYVNHILNEQIRNSNVVRYQKSYIQLEDIYQSYLNTVSNSYGLPTVNEFINKMSPNWANVIEQFFPSSTLWTGGNVIENSRIGRSKHDYEKPCSLNEFTDTLLPDFETAIEEDLELMILGDREGFRGLTILSGVTYNLYVDFNGITYQGSNPISLSGGNLFTPFVSSVTGDTSIIENTLINGSVPFDGSVHLPLICDYKCNLEPNRTYLDNAWKNELENILQTINTKYYKRTLYSGYTECSTTTEFTPTGGTSQEVSNIYTQSLNNHPGWYEYQLSGNTSIDTNFNNALDEYNELYDYEYAPLLDYEFFTDTDGIEKIKVTPLNYDIPLYEKLDDFEVNFVENGSGTGTTINNPCYVEVDFDCINPSSFDFYWSSEYLTGSTDCDLNINVYEVDEEFHVYVSGVTFNNKFDSCGECLPFDNTTAPFNVFVDCADGNHNIEYNNGVFVITGITSGTTLDINVTDAANCNKNINIGPNDQIAVFRGDGSRTIFDVCNLIGVLSSVDIDGTEQQIDVDFTYEPPTSYIIFNQAPSSGSTITIRYRRITDKPRYINGLKTGSQVIKVQSGFTPTTWEDIQNGLISGDCEKINVESVLVGDKILSSTINEECSFSAELFRTSPINGLSFSFNYDVVTVSKNECSGTIKLIKINNKFSVLPNTKLWVLTKTKEDGSQGSKWRFTQKYSEELYIKPLDIIPCCSHDKTYVDTGDFIIDELGFPIEVTDVNLEYCENETFRYIEFEETVIDNEFDVFVFNGPLNEKTILQSWSNCGIDANFVEYDCCIEFTADERLGPITPTPTFTPSSTPTPTPVDCDLDFDAEEIVPTPTPTPTSEEVTPTPTPEETITPTPTPVDCDLDFDAEEIVPTPTPTSTPEEPTPTPTPEESTPTPTPTPEPDCDFDVDVDIDGGIQGTLTPTPTPSPTPFDCDFDVDINLVTPTPTPTPEATPNCDFDVDVNVVTPTPTPTPEATPNCDFDVDVNVVTPTPTPTPEATPDCDFDVDTDIVTPTPTPTPTGEADCEFDVDVNLVTPTPTPSPTPTPDCEFDVDVNVVTPTPTPTAEITPTPTPTPDCDFDVDVNIVTPTPTPSPTFTPSPTPSPTPTPDCEFSVDVDIYSPITGAGGVPCPIPCTTTITTIGTVNTSLSGTGIYDLGGVCTEVRDGQNNVTSTNGQEWWYDSNSCLVSTRIYSGGVGSSCIGEQVTPTGTEVSSFVHTDGTLTPDGTNKLFDSEIRYIDGDNQTIVIVTEWNSTETTLLKVHILCDCSFDGGATEITS